MISDYCHCDYCHGVGACPKCWGRAAIEELKEKGNLPDRIAASLPDKLIELDILLQSIGGEMKLTYTRGEWLADITLPQLNAAGKVVTCAAFSPSMIEALHCALNVAMVYVDAQTALAFSKAVPTS